MTIYEISGTGDDGSILTGTIQIKQKHKMYVGIDFPNNVLAIEKHTKDFSELKYHRIFANPGFPELDSGKMVKLPNDCIRHFSWADDFNPDALKQYLDLMQAKIEFENLPWRVMVTWKHEPMKKIDGPTYRSIGPRIAEICSHYPFVIGNGPILTRFWMDQANGNPDDYWYDGATFFGNDCYNGQVDILRPPSEMFDSTIAYAERRDVPFLIPEYGSEAIIRDTGGHQRSQWMLNCVDYLNKAECTAVAWWCNGVCILDDFPTEYTTWQEIVRTFKG